MIHKKLGLLALLVAAVSCWLWWGGAAAHADTGGYPYADKPCVHAPYQRQGSTGNWCKNYDWGERRNDLSAANVISPYGYYYRNCTDYAAWRLAGMGVPAQQYKGLGNAKAWAEPPARNNLHVNATPVVGSVGVRTAGVYGHVAFVEAVHDNGTITVAQYNRHADGNFSTATGTPARLGLTRFVHFAVLPPPPVVTLAPIPTIEAEAIEVQAVPETAMPATAQPSQPVSEPLVSVEPPPVSVPEAAHIPEPSPAPEPLLAVAEPPAQPITLESQTTEVQEGGTMVAPPARAVLLAATPEPQLVPEIAPEPAAVDEIFAAALAEPKPIVPDAVPPASSADSAPQAPPAPKPPTPLLRSAGFASIVVPYMWPAQPPAIPFVGEPTATKVSADISLVTYVALSVGVIAGTIQALQGHRVWWRALALRGNARL